MWLHGWATRCASTPGVLRWNSLPQHAAALGSRIKIQLGVELGQATEDVSRANRFLDDAPPLDFIIASLHNLSWEYGRGISAPSKKQTKFLPAVSSVNTWMKCWLWPGGGGSACWAI